MANYTHQNGTSGTVQVFTGAHTLDRLVINAVESGTSSAAAIALYDGTSNAGDLVANLNPPTDGAWGQPTSLDFAGTVVPNGLFVQWSASGGTAIVDFTVIWD